jgi:hypothetical protein
MTSNSTLSSFASVTSVGAYNSRRLLSKLRKSEARRMGKPFGVAATILSLFLVVAIFV